MRVFDYLQQSVTEGRTEKAGHITAEITDRHWVAPESEDELAEVIIRLAVKLQPQLDGVEAGHLRRGVLYAPPKDAEPLISDNGVGIWEITVQ